MEKMRFFRKWGYISETSINPDGVILEYLKNQAQGGLGLLKGQCTISGIQDV